MQFDHSPCEDYAMIAKDTVVYNFIEEHTTHEFIFSEASRKSMDEYIAFIYEIYDERLKGHPAMRIILDIHQSGMLPVRYAASIMEKTFKELAPFPKPYVAYLTDGSMDRSLIAGLDYTASKHVDRLHFAVEDRNKAIEWLLTKAIDGKV